MLPNFLNLLIILMIRNFGYFRLIDWREIIKMLINRCTPKHNLPWWLHTYVHIYILVYWLQWLLISCLENINAQRSKGCRQQINYGRRWNHHKQFNKSGKFKVLKCIKSSTSYSPFFFSSHIVVFENWKSEREKGRSMSVNWYCYMVYMCI